MNHMDGKFRAPQFSFRRELEERSGGSSPSKSKLMQLFDHGPAQPAPTPAVVIKRRRAVTIPSENVEPVASTTGASAPDATTGDVEHKQRVFRVDRRDADRASLEPPQETSPAEGAASESGVPDSASSHRRRGALRRRVPDSRRPGDVVVTRPELSTIPLSQLEDELAQTCRLLESLAATPRKWEFDLEVNARWAAVDDALGRLKSSVVPRTVVRRKK
jgi:hypothetical protein